MKDGNDIEGNEPPTKKVKTEEGGELLSEEAQRARKIAENELSELRNSLRERQKASMVGII